MPMAILSNKKLAYSMKTGGPVFSLRNVFVFATMYKILYVLLLPMLDLLLGITERNIV